MESRPGHLDKHLVSEQMVSKEELGGKTGVEQLASQPLSTFFLKEQLATLGNTFTKNV